MGSRWSLDEDDIVRLVYPDGSKSDILRQLPSRTWGSIESRANTLKVKGRHIGGLRIYKINERFFDNYTADMAYILGILYTDGGINAARGTIIIEFKDDADNTNLLVAINRAMNSDYPLCVYKQSIRCFKPDSKLVGLRITRMKMTDVIISKFPFLMAPKEKDEQEWPEGLPKEYERDFIRGHLDGDGSVGYYHRKGRSKSYLSSEFLGGGNLIMEMKSILEERGMESSLDNGGSGLCSMILANTASLKLASFIYHKDMNGLFLKRKYDRFIQGGFGGVNY